MALFTKAPEKTLICDRDLALTNRDRLAAKLTEAEAATIATKSAAQAAALAGDDAALDIAEAAQTAALRRHATIVAANAEAAKMLDFLNEQIATADDQKTRSATTAATLAMADELTEIANGYFASTAALVEVAERVLPCTTEMNGVLVFAQSSLIEVGAAIPVICEALKQHHRAVTNHQAPAAFPKPAPPAAKPVPVTPPATRHVFSVRNIKWTDETGLRVQAGGFECDLPPAVAARGLKTGAVALIGSEAFRTMKGTRPITHPAPERCENLDGNNGSAEPKTDPQMQHERILHAAFEPIDRGPPRLMRIGGTS